jgi:hypothetical protein
MNKVAQLAHNYRTFARGWLLFVGLMVGLLSPGYVQADTPTTTTGVYLPLVVNTGNNSATATPTPPINTPKPTVTPPPATTSTAPVNPPPAALVGAWFVGNAPLNDFYNPQTGEWRDANGLGQMYVFGADGAYTYTGFLRLQNGQCRSEVSVYKQGRVSAQGTALTLTQRMAKTRTVIICPTPQETIVEEGASVTTLTWDVAYDDRGRQQLTVTQDDKPTVFARQGMEPTLAGAWRRGEVSANGFYDPATETFASQTGAGAWFRFTADGNYQFGEFDYGQDNAGCALTGWVYQEGTLEIVGGRLTTTPTSGVARVENECYPDQPQQKPWLDPVKSYTWLVRDRTTDPKLLLIPLEMYQELLFTRE